MSVMPPPGKEKQAPPPKGKTTQLRKWKGLNLTDARVAIDDDELAWLENAMTIGNGAIQILPKQAAAIATLAVAVASMKGFVLTIAGVPTSVLITIHTDGSIRQVTSAGVVTLVAAAATVTVAATLAIWRDNPVLIGDPTTGYFSWTGAVFAVIDATKLIIDMAVFEGRVWQALPSSRTIRFTAPSTFNDFTAANGAGSTVITDDAFPGIITGVFSAQEQLWVVGQGAIEAIANVQATTTGGVTTTTFSVTNIVAGLGSNAPDSLTGYFRALTFAARFGFYALSGVTPQKLSDKLDGAFAAFTFTNCPAAVGVIQNQLVLCFLVTYTQSAAPNLPTPAGGVTTALPILACFSQGKWFFARQGDTLTWVTSLLVNGILQIYGVDASNNVYQLFGASAATEVLYKVQTKLFDSGLSTTKWQMLRLGFEYQGQNAINPTVTVDNEFGSETENIAAGNALVLVNASGGVLQLRNNTPANLNLVIGGMILSRTIANMYGHYLGETIEGTDPPYRIQALQMEIAPVGEWITP